MKSAVKFVVAVLCAALAACSSAPAKKAEVVPAPAPASVAAPAADTTVPEQDLDLAHLAFIHALDMESRGLRAEADSMWFVASKADPGNRFLAFGVAQRLFAAGEDSAAFVMAKRASALPGKQLASQYEFLAKLYVREGIADSARKYFVLALDSSKSQDMTLLYDYSLFLEAVKDKEELVRVYDILLPQTHYIQTLLDRQIALLLELKKDSALVDLFEKAYDVTGDKRKLAAMVHALMAQRRFADARAIADTITSSTDGDGMIIDISLLTFVNADKKEILAFLKKKYYTDGVRVPELFYHLGMYEFMNDEPDSARVHLESSLGGLSRDKTYQVQASRTLAALALHAKDSTGAVAYAVRADSLSSGNGKSFLALVYGGVGKYETAYALLDSMLGVWSNWQPLPGVVSDAAQLQNMKARALANYRNFQRTYADVLITQARKIEEVSGGDTLKMAAAREARLKAQLFWESMVAEDSLNMNIRFDMAKNLERMNRIDESYALFESILKSPHLKALNIPEVLNYYGYTLLNLNRSAGDAEKGLALVVRALELMKPDDPKSAVLDSKAWGLYRLGRYEEALATILLIKDERFLEDDEYLEHLGSIQAALGKKAEATKTFRRLLKVSPKHPAALEYLKGKRK